MPKKSVPWSGLIAAFFFAVPFFFITTLYQDLYESFVTSSVRPDVLREFKKLPEDCLTYSFRYHPKVVCNSVINSLDASDDEKFKLKLVRHASTFAFDSACATVFFLTILFWRFVIPKFEKDLEEVRNDKKDFKKEEDDDLSSIPFDPGL